MSVPARISVVTSVTLAICADSADLVATTIDQAARAGAEVLIP